MDFLNHHHLRSFWVAARENGLTRASEELHVSQPSICTQIQALDILADAEAAHLEVWP